MVLYILSIVPFQRLVLRLMQIVDVLIDSLLMTSLHDVLSPFRLLSGHSISEFFGWFSIIGYTVVINCHSALLLEGFPVFLDVFWSGDIAFCRLETHLRRNSKSILLETSLREPLITVWYLGNSSALTFDISYIYIHHSNNLIIHKSAP